MYTAPALMLLGAVLLYLAAWWYAHDGRALEAPYVPDGQPGTWATDLDAELSMPAVVAARRPRKARKPRKPAMPAHVVSRKPLLMRHGVHRVAIPIG